MKKLKIAHFAAFAPNKTGQYATVKDLIKAERLVGIDAQFIATFVDKKKEALVTTGRKDEWLESVEPDWALKADILVRHSCIPTKYSNAGIPIIMALHGRPESTFIIEYTGVMKCYQLIKDVIKDPRYKGWITFWDEYRFHHTYKVPDDRLYFVPAMVDLEKFCPEGDKVSFGRFAGKPNIIVADMWRHDLTPYNMLYAAAKFQKTHCPEAKVQVFGVPIKTAASVLEVLRKGGILGNIIQRCNEMPKIYRSGDFLITPHNIATRVVRESLACGLPIVAGSANPYTDFKADPRDIDAFTEQIDRCWQTLLAAPQSLKKEARATAEREFNLERTGKAMLAACEDVLKKEITCWKPSGGFKQKQYDSYEHYIKHQQSKLRGEIKWLEDYDIQYRKQLAERLKKLKPLKKGMSVLCLGARLGTEVKAFHDTGCFAVGIDIMPVGPTYVLKGDFQKIVFPPHSVDAVFTNSIDHAFDIRGMAEQIQKVIKPDGLLIVELEGPKQVGQDRWASCQWDDSESVVELFKKYGFAQECKSQFQSIWFREQICFRYKPNTVLNRTDIINSYIEHHKCKKYLEIGSGDGRNFNRIDCDIKVGIDPNFDCDFKMTSDDYFSTCNSEKFDVIFIDGLHTAQQAYKDIENSLNHLSEKGIVFVHDCNPETKYLQREISKFDGKSRWCGDVWKAFVQFKMNRDDLTCYVLDRDFGIGVIHKGGQTVWPDSKTMDELDYEYLEKNRKALLSLREPAQWVKKWESAETQ